MTGEEFTTREIELNLIVIIIIARQQLLSRIYSFFKKVCSIKFRSSKEVFANCVWVLYKEKYTAIKIIFLKKCLTFHWILIQNFEGHNYYKVCFILCVWPKNMKYFSSLSERKIFDSDVDNLPNGAI